MIEWQDEGIILNAWAHGERGAVVHVLTENHGRHAGFVRAGQASQHRPNIQVGTHVHVEWKGRLADQLGHYSFDTIKSYPVRVMQTSQCLLALQSACAMLYKLLPERQPYPHIYQGLLACLEHLEGSMWAQAYIIWEVQLLKALGYGLQLDRCARTGVIDGLRYVSPRSGHAVSKEAGAGYQEKLLTLPAFLTGQQDLNVSEAQQIADGLKLTGYFLFKNLYEPMDKDLPEPRLRLYQDFANQLDSAKQNS